jgi:outer membrane immunogenic protein
MKKLTLVLTAVAGLVSAPALAADLGRMPVKAPVVAPISYFNWSGCYIGVHGGGGFGEKRVFDPPTGVELFRFDTDGALAGGQIGCDWQVGGFVLGFEGSGSWANISGSGLDLPTGVLLRTRAEAEFIATATGRIGWAFDRALLYVKGGGAWVGDDYRVTVPILADLLIARGDHTHAGWTVGAGLEWAFTPNWSIKIEYNYIDVGRDRVTLNLVPGPGTLIADVDQQLHIIKAGLNWRFNFGGPVVASY